MCRAAQSRTTARAWPRPAPPGQPAQRAGRAAAHSRRAPCRSTHRRLGDRRLPSRRAPRAAPRVRMRSTGRTRTRRCRARCRGPSAIAGTGRWQEPTTTRSAARTTRRSSGGRSSSRPRRCAAARRGVAPRGHRAGRSRRSNRIPASSSARWRLTRTTCAGGLDGRTGSRAVRAEHAAIAGLRAEQRLAGGALVEVHARVGRHGLVASRTAVRARDQRPQNGTGSHHSNLQEILADDCAAEMRLGRVEPGQK